MEHFGGKEAGRFVYLYIGISIVCIIITLFIAWQAALTMMLFSVTALFVFRHYIKKRNNEVRELSMQLNEILHGEKMMAINDYEEGELSILKSEIQKMVVRLHEQAEALQNEKIYLKDSIADISHQLRTPLTSIQMIVPRLKNDELTGIERMQLISEINSLLNRVDTLINILLKISKIESGTAKFQKQKVNVFELVRTAVEPLLIPMELREQRFLLQGNEETTFTGDMLWSIEAITNILKNAIEHTPKGGTIEANVQNQGWYAELTICNEGSHISEEDLPYLFERFYQGNQSGKWNVGIGLALTRMIFHRQNGTIAAKNRREGGVMFTIKMYEEVK